MNTNFSGINEMKQLLQADSDLAWGWHCNIAMTISDTTSTGLEWETRNEMAAAVMLRLFDVDTGPNGGCANYWHMGRGNLT